MIDLSSSNQSSRSRQPKPRLGKPHQLLCYAIAAKRYVLFTIDRQGRINISDRDDEENYSRHELGHLLNPIDPEAESGYWIRQFWEMIVGDALGRRVKRPKWFNRPAISCLTATSPDLVLRLQDNRKRAGYARSTKPMNLPYCRARFAFSGSCGMFSYPVPIDRALYSGPATLRRPALYFGLLFVCHLPPRQVSRPCTIGGSISKGSSICLCNLSNLHRQGVKPSRRGRAGNHSRLG